MMKTLIGSPVKKSSRPMRDTSRDWEWINEHADEYRRQWIMVYEGQLIAADPNFQSLFYRR